MQICTCLIRQEFFSDPMHASISAEIFLDRLLLELSLGTKSGMVMLTLTLMRSIAIRVI